MEKARVTSKEFLAAPIPGVQFCVPHPIEQIGCQGYADNEGFSTKPQGLPLRAWAGGVEGLVANGISGEEQGPPTCVPPSRP